MNVLGLSDKTLALGQKAEGRVISYFHKADITAEHNTARVLSAFRNHKVAENYFYGTTGYGYDDRGRDMLEKIYAEVFGAEDALVRTQFVNGTHAIGIALFGVLRPGERLICATGRPYDTLTDVIGLGDPKCGSLTEFGVQSTVVPLADGKPDLAAIVKAAANPEVHAVLLQRSKGYADRISLSCAAISGICTAIRQVNPHAAIVVDNCYGEFVEESEPTAHGADLIVGSLIKNPGGGLAPTGAYIAGRAHYIERAAAHMTVPGIGRECGSTNGLNRALYQGFFLSPHVVAQALKTALFCAAIMEELGYEVNPRPGDERFDIIQSVRFGEPDALLKFCRGIQAGAPVDSFVVPEPWDMPGYQCPVVMAAGAFIQGASIELSADAPMREPYIAYLQGGLTYESGKLGVLLAVEQILKV